MQKNKIPTKPFTDDALIERLRKNPKELKKFKDYLISEYKKDNDIDGLLSCLRIVVMAQRGAASQIAAKSGMHRVGIYKALMKDVRPRIDTLQSILNGVGLGISITKLHEKSS
jgi:DNA-binding phage protein